MHRLTFLMAAIAERASASREMKAVVQILATVSS